MKIEIGETYSKITDLQEDDDLMEIDIQNKLSVMKPGYYFTDAYKKGFWDGSVKFYNRKTHTFPTGLLPYVKKALEDEDVDYEDNRAIMNFILPDEIRLGDGDKEDIILRDYQYSAVSNALSEGNGIINIATNGGKTEVAAGIIQQIIPRLKAGETVLFFTHSKEIFHQSAERLAKRLEMEVGKVGDGAWVVKPLTLVMIPTVSRYIKEPSTDKIKYAGEHKAMKLLLDFFKEDELTKEYAYKVVEALQDMDSKTEQDAGDILLNFLQSKKDLKKQFAKMKKELRKFEEKKLGKSLKKHKEVLGLLESARAFMADEAHHSSSETWYDTFMLCKNSRYRFGLTGTVDEKDELNNFRLRACTGDIISKVSNDFLIKRGISAKPTIFLEEVYEPELPAKITWQNEYKAGIVENEYRNQLIADRVTEKYEEDKTSLIIVSRVEHGYRIQSRLKGNRVISRFTYGDLDSETRQDILQDTKDGKLKVLIATNILDEGVDVDNIDCLFMAAAGKSFRQVLQRVGRGLRVSDRKNTLEVYDYLDFMSRTLTKHTKERFNYYRNEGFKIKKF